MRKPIKFLDLLKQIKNEEINVDNIKIEYLDKVFEYNFQEGIFVNTSDNELLLSDIYNDIDLPNMTVMLITDTDKNKFYKLEPWKKEIATDFIKKYIDLELSLDNCQGCTDDSEDMLNTMKYYKEQIIQLGADFNVLHKLYLDIAYKSIEIKEIEKQKRDMIIKPLELDWITLTQLNNSATSKLLIQVQDKINEICRIIREEQINE